MESVDQFFEATGVALLMLFLAGVVRSVRPWHVPALVNGWNPWGRKFDQASALKQNQFVVRMCLAGAAFCTVFGIGALVVGLVQQVK